MIFIVLVYITIRPISCFWDVGSTTPGPFRTDTIPRTSFFRWQEPMSHFWAVLYPNYDWDDVYFRRRLQFIAGISIDFIPLGVATIMNRRILVTSANYLDPHMDRQKSLRIWTLSRMGLYNTPFRYRVWRVHRLFPKSNNPEHLHGPRGEHSPRHDVTVIISMDQMYIYSGYYTGGYQYPCRATLTDTKKELTDVLWMAGSGYEYLEHIYENYKIFYAKLFKKNVVDCSKYIPKWWGKFICIINHNGFPGLSNGGGLFTEDNLLVGLGCFEIRYNEDKIYVFTDLRYYVRWIHKLADITPGQYYEYAYPEHFVRSFNLFFMKDWMTVMLPHKWMWWDLYPLG